MSYERWVSQHKDFGAEKDVTGSGGRKGRELRIQTELTSPHGLCCPEVYTGVTTRINSLFNGTK